MSDGLRRVGRAAWDEVAWLNVRVMSSLLVMSLLPPFVGSRMRRYILRMAGFEVGAGTVIFGRPTITGRGKLQPRLRIGRSCVINLGCRFDLGADIEVGDEVSIGAEVMILTTSHELADEGRRAGPLQTSPVRIEDQAWICSRATILPGVTIGRGAVVAAGAVVNRSVDPHTVAGGVPAQVLRQLPVLR